ncbi:MAG: amidohydrolase [Clostridiales bacterium]|nr:amidohydrolase [Clostridiales bacterium]
MNVTVLIIEQAPAAVNLRRDLCKKREWCYTVTMKDFIVKNANIYTQDKEHPWAEAFAVRGGKFACVGTNEEIDDWVVSRDTEVLTEPEEMLDLNGRFVMPGIIDSHTHIAMSVFLGGDDDEMPMCDCRSKEEVLQKLKEMVRKHPFRLFYAMFYGKVEILADDPITRDDLDRIVRFRPVILLEEECHSAILNSAALRYFKIKEDATDIAPGLSRYERDDEGRLTGMITEMTMVPILATERPKEQELRLGITKLLSYLISRGVTTIFEAGNMTDEDFIFRTFRSMDEEGKIPVRMFMSHMLWHPDMVEDAIEQLKRYKGKYETANVRFETMKMMFDGTQRIHTACMVEPYADTGTCGGTLISEDRLLDFMRELNHEGIDFHLHTVGEGAVRKVMNCVEKLRAEGDSGAGEPFRITVTCAHDEVLRPEDIGRFRELGIVANFTPSWNGGNCGSEPENMQKLLGPERGIRTLQSRTVFDTGATVSFSSDEVELHRMSHWSPFWGMEVGLTRQDPDFGQVREDGGMDGAAAPIYPPAEERLTLEQLIEGYTLGGAKQLGVENQIGSIETGKDADFLVLGENLFEVDPYRLHDVVPERVYIKGKLQSVL